MAPTENPQRALGQIDDTDYTDHHASVETSGTPDVQHVTSSTPEVSSGYRSPDPWVFLRLLRDCSRADQLFASAQRTHAYGPELSSLVARLCALQLALEQGTPPARVQTPPAYLPVQTSWQENCSNVWQEIDTARHKLVGPLTEETSVILDEMASVVRCSVAQLCPHLSVHREHAHWQGFGLGRPFAPLRITAVSTKAVVQLINDNMHTHSHEARHVAHALLMQTKVAEAVLTFLDANSNGLAVLARVEAMAVSIRDGVGSDALFHQWYTICERCLFDDLGAAAARRLLEGMTCLMLEAIAGHMDLEQYLRASSMDITRSHLWRRVDWFDASRRSLLRGERPGEVGHPQP